MMIGRYSFGPWTILFPIALNCLACIGWSTINTIVGASALKAVSSTHELPEPAGIVIIAVLTLVVALFGYRIVHAIERYAAIPVIIIFVIMYGQAGRYMSGGMGGMGEAEAANVLSFGGTIAGFALGWTSLAADYTVYMKQETASWKVFACTYLGLNFPRTSPFLL
jgi:purine-cytosine permease-like protein